jgi:hypothetical protein
MHSFIKTLKNKSKNENILTKKLVFYTKVLYTKHKLEESEAE